MYGTEFLLCFIKINRFFLQWKVGFHYHQNHSVNMLLHGNILEPNTI